jgi:oligopeptide transport system permease protein
MPLIIALCIGVTAGVLPPCKPNTAQDYVPMSLRHDRHLYAVILLGPLLVLVFGIWLDWLPDVGVGRYTGR